MICLLISNRKCSKAVLHKTNQLVRFSMLQEIVFILVKDVFMIKSIGKNLKTWDKKVRNIFLQVTEVGKE